MRRLRVIDGCLIVFAIGACGGVQVTPQSTRELADAPSWDGQSCDTIPVAAWSGVAMEGALPSAEAASWHPLLEIRRSGFSISAPASATIDSTPPDLDGHVLHVTRFPGCGEHCWVSVRFLSDSAGEGVDAHVARILRAEAVVDSINNDPRTTVFHFNDYHGPPRPVRVGDRRGIWLYGDCGDCESESLFVAGEHSVAEISYGIGSVPFDSRRGCRLAQVAQTFRWRGGR
ncbi:MAG: hypothetical protein ACSLFE_03255 [Gemmatimonadaceae bacterium]